MPTCTSGYRTEEIDKIMNGRSILDIALTLHGYCNGSNDCYLFHKIELINDIKCIKFYLDYWIEDTTKPCSHKYCSLKNSFDNNVKQLLISVSEELIYYNLWNL